MSASASASHDFVTEIPPDDMRGSSDIALTIHERVVLAVVTAIVAVIGICLNGISAFLILRLRVFRNAFGCLMALNSLSNVGVLTTFLFWAAPVMIL
ncbi:hypothetical protein Y032_0287g1427 [Ancylostoma ceylanicum]|uniref:7TM GPCR serpentine receptor class x (Srx) domain-containing protein n=1 Tax=Ancylostoma ceylanicum TaxID=53326 RepID=A0A016S6H3_9BILA|nr:hypothetical protein Y032_0287g1427 [Ancylostoma ceylanicum]